MTDAHNPRVLSDADSAADLAGLPRPVSEPSELALEFAARDPQCLYAWTGRIIDINTVLIKREELRTLVSERDALAVRVRELEQENSKLVSTLAECRDIFLAPPPGGAAEHEWMQAMGCPESVPNFIRAALTPQEKTNG